MSTRELIARTLGHEPTLVVEIDEGYDFKVSIVDDAWVFRFPRRPDAVQWLATEIDVLPLIASALPIAVPRFEHVSRDPPFVGYRLIEGRPLVDEDADGVCTFLNALHAVEPARVPRPDWIALYRDHCDRFTRNVIPLLERELHDAAHELFAEVGTLSGFVPAVVHCDLGPAHLLVHNGRLHGVIDWSHVSVGDPALDYAWLLNVPFPGWDVDDQLRRRARFYHRLGPWFEADYGVRFARPDYVESGLAGVSARLSTRAANT